MKALQYAPYAFWRLDDATPFDDYSGYARSATLTGTEKRSVAQTSHCSYSQVLQSDTTITLTSSIFQSNLENAAFTLCATITPVIRTTAGEQQIISHAGTYDGLTINGTVVSFVTKYLTAGESRCSYDLGFTRRATVVGVHSFHKNSLYVDGVLVDESAITDAQKIDQLLVTGSTLVSGTTVSNQALMINDIILYGRDLSAEEIYQIVGDANHRPNNIVPPAFGGYVMNVSQKVRPAYVNVEWNSDDDWNNASLVSVYAEDGTLYPEEANSIVLKGVWIDSVDLDFAQQGGTINSVALVWQGSGVVVECSLDGQTWTAATNGQNTSLVPAGFNVANQTLFVRVTFSGTASDYLSYLQVLGYQSNQYVPPAGRTLTFGSPSVTLGDRAPLELHESWGTRLFGSSLSAGADSSSTPYNPLTIEVWMKRNSATAPTYSFVPTTTYVNGSSHTIRTGEWALYHFVLPAAVSTFSITGDVTIGQIALYDVALSAAQVASIYKNYVSCESLLAFEDNVLSITQSDSPFMYTNLWELVSA